MGLLKKFKVAEDETEAANVLCSVVGTLEEIKDLAEYQQVTVIGKILSAAKPEQIIMKNNGKNLQLQMLLQL